MASYLDYAATSPMTEDVLAAYSGALGLVGNPSSIHGHGQAAKRMLEEAREAVAASVGADPAEVTFTSGGTEAINLAVKGLFWARNPESTAVRPRVLIAAGEHHATIEAAAWLAAHEGAVVEEVAVDEYGRIDLVALEAALGQDVALLSVLFANNEVGTIQPIDAVIALADMHDVPVHVDAVAAFGYLPIDFHALGAAALSISAHKIGGPVSIGALVIARSATIVPLIHGGNQQRGRSGTQAPAAALAFGVAATAATTELAGEATSLLLLRDRLIAGIRSSVPTAVLRGDPVDRLPGNVHFTFPGCEGDSLLFLLDSQGFSVSTGSACQAGVPEASHVLLAMGLSEQDARGALRITVGHDTTVEEIDAFLAVLPEAVESASRAGLASRVVTMVERPRDR